MSDRPRVLAVDDSATIRKAMELVLDPADYELELAASGSEAIAKAKEFLPQVILLDFILPDMRGADVCQRLSEDAATVDIPIVLISAKGAEIRQAYDDIPSVVSYITKPFTPAGVTSVIDEAISGRAAAAAAAVAEAAPALPPAAYQPATDGHEARVDEDLDEADSGAWEAEEEEIAPSLVRPAASVEGRAAVDGMFETLRSSLEGVFVEEMDTRAGAAADQALSHSDLAERLARQMREALRQTQSGARHHLCSDGSIRSLDESLLDTYRRLCRLLFRAVQAGAVTNEMVTQHRPRVLFLCRRSSELFERLQSIAQERADDWICATISADFRQLPIMARLFGPTHVVVEAIPGAALWDQISILRGMPEGKRLSIIGVAAEGRGDGEEKSGREVLAAHGIESIVGAGSALPQVLGERIAPPAAAAGRVTAAPAAAPGEGATVAAPAY